MVNAVVPFENRKLCTLIASNRYADHPDELYSEERKVAEFFAEAETRFVRSLRLGMELDRELKLPRRPPQKGGSARVLPIQLLLRDRQGLERIRDREDLRQLRSGVCAGVLGSPRHCGIDSVETVSSPATSSARTPSCTPFCGPCRRVCTRITWRDPHLSLVRARGPLFSRTPGPDVRRSRRGTCLPPATLVCRPVELHGPGLRAYWCRCVGIAYVSAVEPALRGWPPGGTRRQRRPERVAAELLGFGLRRPHRCSGQPSGPRGDLACHLPPGSECWNSRMRAASTH